MTQDLQARGFETVIGLEVHVQLATQTKIFCRCATAFGGAPNSQVCPVCIGLPGALPVLNQQAVEFAIALGLATHCQIAGRSVFARKNYFYPDLPKGYQISQYELPLCERGHIEIDFDGAPRRIGITRIHMEEDAGKLIHASASASLVDLNRSSVPLLEIVSEPDMRGAKEAGVYMRALHSIVRYLGISDGNMEEGSLRCDANISVRRLGEKAFGTKVELKNLNSFRFVERAIEYEAARQVDEILGGGTIRQETRLYDNEEDKTRPMRTKEFAHDYRYFPDPDLLPLHVDEAWIARVREKLPELPRAKRDRLMKDYDLPAYDADVLTQDQAIARYFEDTVAVFGAPEARKRGKAVSNWVMSELMRTLKESGEGVEKSRVTPQLLAGLLQLIDSGRISGKIAKTVFARMTESGKSAAAIVAEEGLEQVSDSGAIETTIKSVLQEHAKEVAEFRSGKTKLMGFFVGQVMKATQGKANPQTVNALLQKLLGATEKSS